ncbi:hypothetical protein [Streptomyces sp. NRRL WC-3549]|uniref:hypothetical protein n=1 Tax=Streptomyces sp. NRRL WC-3549 TaxID=1463925 RepID=UPI0004CBD0D2|nr:hypothetical protein [Streptomyces sp. NRRL WC-3549]
MNDVRELLERAAADAGRPAVSTGAVYARARKIRYRRRAAVSVAALAVVAAGAAALPGVRDVTGTEPPSVATAPVAQKSPPGKAARLAALLPEDVGSVEKVSLRALIGNGTSGQGQTAHAGPLDGEYMVRKDGGAGYLVVKYLDRAVLGERPDGTEEDDLCAPGGVGRPLADCVRDELPDGSVLTTWSDPMEHAGRDGTPLWGPELNGRLELKDGSLLGVRASSGYLGKRSQGPLLTSPPLDQEQLRALMRQPGLIPAV